MKNPITRKKFFVLEFVFKSDLELCLKSDGIEWQKSKMQVQRVK